MSKLAALSLLLAVSLLLVHGRSRRNRSRPHQGRLHQPAEDAQNIAFEDPSGKTIGETKTLLHEQTTSVVVNLKPGVYHYYSTLPGHRQAGMEGTLVVKPAKKRSS